MTIRLQSVADGANMDTIKADLARTAQSDDPKTAAIGRFMLKALPPLLEAAQDEIEEGGVDGNRLIECIVSTVTTAVATIGSTLFIPEHAARFCTEAADSLCSSVGDVATYAEQGARRAQARRLS